MAAVGNGHAYRQPQTWLGAVDIGYLTEEERDAILQVIQRDEQVRVKEEQRVIKLKADLRDVKRKGAKLADHSYSQRVCARCNSKMGIIFNAPTQCPVCKHKVCKTDVKKRTINPVFGKRLKFSVSHSELSTRTLELSVWHAGTFSRNLFLGEVLVPLDNWDWDSKNENWFPLRQKDALNADFAKGSVYRGDFFLALKFVPCRPSDEQKTPYGELHLLIKGAKNLMPLRSSRTVDSFVKILMQPNRQLRQKTPVISKTTSPEWNYNVRFPLQQPIEERRHNFRQRTLSSEAESVPTSPQVSRQTKSLPRNLPPMSPQRHPKMADVATLLLAQHKKFKAREVDKSNGYGNGGEDVNNQSYMLSREDSLEVDDELASDSSIDSRSIDGAFEEYLQQQKDQMRSNNDAKQRWRTYTVSRSSSAPYSGDEDTPDHKEEEKDAVDKLPPTAAPRRLNEKLVRQNKFSASVPTVYQSPASPTRNGGMGSNRKISSSTVSLDYQHSRDMSSSVPNLSQSNTSLNSVGLHDLTITGEVKFSLGYNYKANFLLVNVVECRNIATADRRRKRSDPYVKCYLLPDRKH